MIRGHWNQEKPTHLIVRPHPGNELTLVEDRATRLSRGYRPVTRSSSSNISMCDTDWA